MNRLFIFLGILAVLVGFVVYQFTFADRRSTLKIDPAKGDPSFSSEVSFNESSISNETRTRLLSKRGTMSFEVTDVIATRDAIQTLTKEFEGYVAGESRNSNGGTLRVSQTVRIPTAVVDEFTRRIEGLASEVIYKNLSVEDVTKEYVDVESRLLSKKKLEARYHEILQSGKTVTDLLEIENRLGVVREDIELMEARCKHLVDETSFVTMELAFSKNESAINAGFGSDLVKSLKYGWEGLLVVVVGMVTVWPLVIVASLGMWLYFRQRVSVAVK